MSEDFSQSLDRYKESFLFAAAQGGNVQDCDALIEIGADINWKGPGGDTPLLSACRRGHVETVALLLAHGADPNAKGGDSMAPLHIATQRGDPALLNILMDSNVDTTVKTREGMSALDLARTRGYDDIYALLTQKISGSGDFEVMRPQRQSTTENDASQRRLSTTGSSRIAVNSFDSNKLSQVRNSLPSIVSPRMVVSQDSTMPVQVLSSALNNIGGSTRIVTKPVLGASNSAMNEVKTDIAPQSQTKYALINSKNSDGTGSTGGINSVNSKVAAAAAMAAMDETSLALQTLLAQEQRERKALEGKMQLIKEQVTFLTTELKTTKLELGTAIAEREQLVGALDLLRGSPSALAALTTEQCEQLEAQLRSSLEAVEKRKATLIQNALESQKEQRLCIVCQVHDKCVVLLPCRHMCLCEECSAHQLLDHCPLCRRPIAHKISVFS